MPLQVPGRVIDSSAVLPLMAAKVVNAAMQGNIRPGI